MRSVECVAAADVLKRAPVELPTDTVSEQVISDTRKGSWFGSISRKRKRKDPVQPALETLVTEEPPNTVPEAELTLPLRTASPTTSDDHQPVLPPVVGNTSVEPPNHILLDNVPPPSWSPTSPPRTVPQNVQGVLSKPTHLDLLSPTISISSVDDVVPQPKSSPALSFPVPPQNSVPVGVGGVGDVTTTGMTGITASRFTLRIPLLGRPKIPLNQAVAVAQAEDVRNSPSTTPVHSDSTIPSSTAETEEAQRPGIPAVPSNISVWRTGLSLQILMLVFRQMYCRSK